MYYKSPLDTFILMNIQEKVGIRVKEIRNKKGLTQEALAWKSEVDRTFMNHVENGKRNISLLSLEKIVVNGLETTLREFFESEVFNGGTY
jgi:transcriptional regulator with XRE-family HTH domain